MRPEDVPVDLVEKAARATYYADPFYQSVFGKILEPREVLPWDELDLADIQEMRQNARHALAAVIPEIQAQALRDAADDLERQMHEAGDGVAVKVHGSLHRRVLDFIRYRALSIVSARLAATTEEG